MFQKVSNILSIASFVLIVSTLISAFFGYKYVTSEQFKAKMKNEVLAVCNEILFLNEAEADVKLSSSHLFLDSSWSFFTSRRTSSRASAILFNCVVSIIIPF